MIDTEFISTLQKAIDNLSKALDEFYAALPRYYLRTEMLHPKKKPRGSIRRARRERAESEVKVNADSD